MAKNNRYRTHGVVIAGLASLVVSAAVRAEDTSPMVGSETIEINQCLLEGPHITTTNDDGTTTLSCAVGYAPVVNESTAEAACVYVCLPAAESPYEPPPYPAPVPPPSDPPAPPSCPDGGCRDCDAEANVCFAAADVIYAACLEMAEDHANDRCDEGYFPSDPIHTQLRCTIINGRKWCKLQLPEADIADYFSYFFDHGGSLHDFCVDSWLNPHVENVSGASANVGSSTVPIVKDHAIAVDSQSGLIRCDRQRAELYNGCLDAWEDCVLSD